jgi:hypothetical protein
MVWPGGDSGGAGKFRGGLSIERECTLLEGDAHLAVRSDRRDHPPYGLQGGGHGTPSKTILRQTDSKEVLPTMISTRMQIRETIYHKQPGLRFDGLQAYHGGGSPIRDDGERAAYARQTMNLAVETRRLIEASGLLCPIVFGTGTATFRALLDLVGLTELRVGTYVLMDWAFKERIGDLFEIALTVLATVITASNDQFVLDVGTKGLGNGGGALRFPGTSCCNT